MYLHLKALSPTILWWDRETNPTNPCSYYGEAERHLKVGSGEHNGIIPVSRLDMPMTLHGKIKSCNTMKYVLLIFFQSWVFV